MRVLVTGGAGYIGSIVTEELQKENHEVVVYDNLVKGYREAVPPGVVFVAGDLLEEQKLRETLRKYRIEAVIHMAAYSIVSESMGHPLSYYKNNVMASLVLLNAMKDCSVPGIVFSSTAAVYGESAVQPIEETAPLQPTNPYGETKVAVERALRWYSHAYGIRYASLRYFNAAGASQQYGEFHTPETHLIPLVLQTAAGLRPYVDIFGDDYPTRDGTCVRDYIHVVDLARAHVACLKNLDNADRIYNLGCGGDGYTVKEVIETARRVTGREIPTRVIKRRPGDPAVLIASSWKIMQELGWKPEKQDLSEILRSSWEWLKNHPFGYRSTVRTIS